MTDFFRQIPKAPGHYCRKDSNKTYVIQIVQTLNKLYEVYKARCSALNKPAFPVGKFSNYFNGNNFLYLKGKKTNVIRAGVMMKVTEKNMYLMLIK